MRLLLLLLLAGCPAHTAVPDAALPDGSAGDILFGFACQTLCYRPGDCQIAYPDNDICPAGFLCGRTFTCVSDGGGTD